MWLSFAFAVWLGTDSLYTGIGRAAGAGFLAWARLDASLTLTQLLLLLTVCGVHCLVIRVGVHNIRLMVYVTTPLTCTLYLAIIVWACNIAPIRQSLGWPAATGSFNEWITAINAIAASCSSLVRCFG